MNLKKWLLLICILGLMSLITGCGSSSSDLKVDTEVAFSSGFYSTASDMHVYFNYDGLLELLDFQTMHHALICNKPNCDHKNEECIMRKVNDIVPVFNGHDMYYFADDQTEIVINEAGATELKMGTSLFRYNLESGNEEKIMHMDGYIASIRSGMLLRSDMLYFIGNQCSRYYDESGNIIAFGNAGGESHLYCVNLSDKKVQDLGLLYDVNKLAEYYPQAPNSGEVVMRGFYNDNIYFDVDFVEGSSENDMIYREYVTNYNLSDGTYHGTPEDYENIDFAAVRYVSEDYLVICRDGEAAVYKKHAEQPIVLKDPGFNMDAFLSVFDDTLYCGERIYDLNTCTARTLDRMQYKSVVAKYGDSYIISDLGMQGNFEKIPAEELLK